MLDLTQLPPEQMTDLLNKQEMKTLLTLLHSREKPKVVMVQKQLLSVRQIRKRIHSHLEKQIVVMKQVQPRLEKLKAVQTLLHMERQKMSQNRKPMVKQSQKPET